MKTPNASRAVRLREFLRRLDLAPPAASHDEAMRQIVEILNRVEDEMTTIPHDPTLPINDGRMYPPQPDSKRSVSGRADLTRYRSKGHSTLIGNNGSIRIVQGTAGPALFAKPGADGQIL